MSITPRTRMTGKKLRKIAWEIGKTHINTV